MLLYTEAQDNYYNKVGMAALLLILRHCGRPCVDMEW